MKSSGILFILLAGCLIHVKGQETMRFHPDPVLFAQGSREFFGSQRPEDSKAILLKLEDAQKNGLLEENHWIDLAQKANAVEKLGARPFPHFHNLLNAFLLVATSRSALASYRVWSGHLDELLRLDKKSLTQANNFLEFTIDLSLKGILYKTNAFQWRVRAGQNEFGKDSALYVTVSQSNLVAEGSGDSIMITSTRGRYYPDANRFYGTGGQITWQRFALPAADVSVMLDKYSFDLNRPAFTVDSARLIDRRYFTGPISGKAEDKILPGVAPENAGYPRFTSYELRNRIKNLYPDMDYEGGFSLQGLKVLGTGMPDQKSTLTIFRKQKPLLRLASTHFSFQSGQARGINAEASIYLDTDSIYHPGLLFQYNEKNKEISLIRDGQGLSPSRFIDTYHDFDLKVDWIRWKIGEDQITMSGLPGSNENRATFESADFFNIDRYNEILIADKKHPVAAVKQCADYYYSRKYTLNELARFMEMPQHLVEEMLLRLSFLGFVRYNSENQQVDVQDRAYDFLKKNAGLQDYDVIRFESAHKPPEVNATLNLLNNNLKVFWIQPVRISESRNVIIYPAGDQIEILKGREILFDGEVQAGLIRFTGKQFRFSYEDFTIHLNQVGQMKIRVVEKMANENQEPVLADVTSVIEYTRGLLKIDEPSNKSGLKKGDLPEYPMLVTDTNAYVYYDQREILGGVYPRKNFNFNIFPFTLKGLNQPTLADSLNFPGVFNTAEIFPPLELSLKHQADHSLGFETLKTPEEGYPVYNGKGRFFNSLAMSRAGLIGSGRLEYLNSSLVSKSILFLPNQVTAIADLAVNRDSSLAGNPETYGDQLSVTWYPGSDRLVAQRTKDPLSMYGNGLFDGELSVEPESLTGKGTITFKGYSITSGKFKFFENKFEALESELKIFSDTLPATPDPAKAETAGNLLVARKFNSIVDIENQQARFIPASEQSRIEFTRNLFEGRPANFNWDITGRHLVLDSVKLSMASRPSDSLNFISGQAGFALQDAEIRASGVEFIDVADVRIFPADGNVLIGKDARIDSLTQATIVSKDQTLVHRITNATVTVVDHKRYRARGNYQYQDIAKREFPIVFSDIQPDRQGISYGKGTISQEDNFSLSPAFKYYGEVEWNNNERFLLFDGQTQFTHSCPDITIQWIRFASRIFPDSVAIPIDSVTTNDQKEPLFKGFYLSNQPSELYSTFVGLHTRYSDQPVISANGLLWYDDTTGRYLLTSREKKADPETDGPIMTLDAGNCIAEASGQLTLGVDLGQVKLKGAGVLTHDLRQDSVRGSVILTLDFFFDPKILEFMARSINDAAGLEPVNYSNPSFREAFKDLAGRANGEELLRQLSLTGKWRKIPDVLLHTMVLADVRLKWNPETGSYQSTGKIGITNILEESINKKVNGFLEVVHRRGGDVLTLYLEIDRQNYFFLTYSRGLMQCVAGPGLEKFNIMLRGLKEGKLKQETGPGEVEYQYNIGTYQQVSAFLRKFNVER